MKTKTVVFKLTSREVSILSNQIYELLKERRDLAYKLLRGSKQYKEQQEKFIGTAKAVYEMVRKSGVPVADVCGRYVEHKNGKPRFSVRYAQDAFERSEWYQNEIKKFCSISSPWDIERAIRQLMLDLKFSGESISKSDLIDKILKYL